MFWYKISVNEIYIEKFSPGELYDLYKKNRKAQQCIAKKPKVD